jgi:hypothetical protein
MCREDVRPLQPPGCARPPRRGVWAYTSILAHAFSYGFALWIGWAFPCAAQAPPASASRLQELTYFLGDWDCSGKFTRSGAAIEAHLQFESILGESFILFHHDDKPPHNYHAWSEWGWDPAGKQFFSTIQDSTGGTRTFRSVGWQQDRLTWEGGSPASDAPAGLPQKFPGNDQQFVFERISPKQFRVSYAVRKDADWATVDVSTCTRVDKPAAKP